MIERIASCFSKIYYVYVRIEGILFIIQVPRFGCSAPNSVMCLDLATLGENKCHFSFCFLFFFFFLFTYFWDQEREIETEHEQGRARERGRHRIWSRFQAVSCQHRTQHGAGTHQPWEHNLSWSWTLNLLRHSGTPNVTLHSGGGIRLHFPDEAPL